jgi:choice-of-anchor A domain-containing protein
MTASKLALALIAGSLSGVASASTGLTAQQILEQFNLVTLGNVTSSSHVDGRSYIGGTLTGSGAVFAMHPQDIAPSTYAGLTVAGSASGLQVTSNGAVIGGDLSNYSTINSGTAYVGGSATSATFNGAAYVKGNASGYSTFNQTAYVGGNATSSSFNGTAYVAGNATSNNFNRATYVAGNAQSNTFGGGYLIGGTATSNNLNSSQLSSAPSLPTIPATVAAATSTDFATTLTSLSNSASKLTGNSTWSIDSASKTVTFTAVADANKLAVFDLSSLSSTYYSGYKFLFSLGSAKTVIMNVAATGTLDFSSSFDDMGGYATMEDMASKVIWNFNGVSDLTTERQFRGSILATSAHLTNNQNIEGVVMVNTLTQKNEIHATAFAGNVSAVPEPETYAMLLGGLALMAGIARRRRAA